MYIALSARFLFFSTTSTLPPSSLFNYYHHYFHNIKSHNISHTYTPSTTRRNANLWRVSNSAGTQHFPKRPGVGPTKPLASTTPPNTRTRVSNGSSLSGEYFPFHTTLTCTFKFIQHTFA
eukprot:TRINITY_DN9321_c0_g1_i2.p2 TRINITY_DN9321_c0_g1~~TRINITY_DN9321_c0_g1_i2.p2  ORF type:complete len:120 (+),score=14.06 TRINITY_DN9321_c0_g1_i2:210-569(+)